MKWLKEEKKKGEDVDGFSCESPQEEALSCRCKLTVSLSLSLSVAFLQVNVDDTAEMLPKSRRALTIQEIAALARSSLHGEFRQRLTKKRKNQSQILKVVSILQVFHR